MTNLFGGRNRSLLFRSYLYLAGGLLIVAFLLDLGFGYLQADQESDPWLERTITLVDAELAAVPEAERAAAAARLSEQLGVNVQVLAVDDVAMTNGAEERPIPLVDAEGRTSYLHNTRSLDSILIVGPVEDADESLLVRLLPPLFYLSIFVVVGLWLQPLLKDINHLSDSAQRFAADYREPTATVDDVRELKGLAGNIDDMSARISALLRSQKELIAALSHEMRTPLARIRFALAVIANKGNKGDDDLKAQVEALDADVREIDELIASMLNYARLDHPEVRMHWQDVPIRNWLKLMIDKASTDGEIELDISNCPASARMDPRLMELALSNLLVNARRYGNGRVRCTLTSTGGDCVLAVEDDGQGIPQAERDAVFKAFTRIDDSRNRETGGVGLGLAIVARIAELHGGEAGVEQSAELGGAKFRIRWPAT